MTRDHLRLVATSFATSAWLLAGCVNLDAPWPDRPTIDAQGGQDAMADPMADTRGSGGGATGKGGGAGRVGGKATVAGSTSSDGGSVSTGGTPATSDTSPDAAGSSEESQAGTATPGTEEGGANADAAIDAAETATAGAPNAAAPTERGMPAGTPQDLAVDIPVARDAGEDATSVELDATPDSPPAARDAGEDPPEIADADAVPDSAPAGGPLVYYPCEQALAALLPDGSGNNRNANLVGTFAFAAGKVGNALSLTPSGAAPGYAVLPTGILSSATEMTIATWVKINTNASWARIFHLGNDTTTFMFLTPNNTTNGKLRFGITTAGYATGVEQVIDGTAALPTGTWKHVAVVLGSTGGRLYVDGVQVGSNTTMTLRPNSLGKTVNNWIGKSEFATDPYLDGLIDEFRIYDRELSPAEVLALFNG